MSTVARRRETLAHPLSPELREVTLLDLAGLLVSLALVAAPHALRSPAWIGILTACLYGWRLLLQLNRAPLPARGVLLSAAALAILGVLLEYRTIFGRVPGIELLVIFSGLKLLETRNHRDAAVVTFLGYFLLITNFLYTQSIPTALLMALALGASTATLVGFSAPRRPIPDNLRTAGQLLAYAVPAAFALFLLFPRVQGPLWGLPQDLNVGTTGLSDTMAPGSLSQVAQNDAVAFRAEFAGATPPPRQRYWRGPVLWDFDGRVWSAGQNLLLVRQPEVRGASEYRYAVILEPHGRNWLFALERAASLPERARYSDDGQVMALAPVRARLRYEMVSIAEPEGEPRETGYNLRRALRLPSGSNPRALALAQGWRAASSGPGEILAKGIDFFREGRFIYTLEPPLLGRDSIDEFLFGTRAGFCEHFAASFVFLMRAAGVPARVVTGYQGGDPNPIDKIITVRQAEAHAWAEVFLAGRGWLRVDPTAAAVPGRIDSGLARSVPQGDPLPLLMRPQLEWLRGLRYNWEALTHRWNMWVLGYNPDRQRELLAFLGMPGADWGELTATLVSVLGAFTIVLLIVSLRRYARPDPVQGAWQSFCRKLGARGVQRAAHEGPRDFTARAARALPAAHGAILAIGALYVALRYGRRAAPDGVAELRRRVRELSLA